MSETEPTATPAEEGIRQTPVRIRVAEPATVTHARDALLAAIGTEAQAVAEKSAGQASAALVELARAYALVTARISAGAPGEARGSLIRSGRSARAIIVSSDALGDAAVDEIVSDWSAVVDSFDDMDLKPDLLR
ncbi:hypothetical protein ACQKGQ_28665 [Bacillus cereus]|uniref:hypothetical protein n=1 Tax=Bacillus cereus TaxID=1396 RepID=UPI003D050146